MEEFSLLLQLNFEHELSALARKADLVENISNWHPRGPMLTSMGSFLFVFMFVLFFLMAP